MGQKIVPKKRNRTPLIEPVDVPGVTEAAKAKVTAELGPIEARGNPDELLDAAVKIITDASEQVERLRDLRDNYIASLVLWDGFPAQQAAKAAGVAPSLVTKTLGKRLSRPGEPAWKLSEADPETLPEVAKSYRVRRYSIAAKDIRQVGTDLTSAKARIEAATPYRDRALRALAKQGVLHSALAERAKVNPSRISHIVTGRGAGTPAPA